MTIRDSYAALDLAQGADLEEVKAAFRRLAFATHPDLHPESGPQAFQKINTAYLTLRAHLEGDAAQGPEQGTSQQSAANAYAKQQKPWNFWRPGDAKWKPPPRDGQKEAKSDATHGASRNAGAGRGASGGGRSRGEKPTADGASAGSKAGPQRAQAEASGAGAQPGGAHRAASFEDAAAGAASGAARASASGTRAGAAGAKPESSTAKDRTTGWKKSDFEKWIRGGKAEGPGKRSQPAADGARKSATEQSWAKGPAKGSAKGSAKDAERPAAATAGMADAEDERPWFERRDEVLRDVLQDPYARQVFEEIYSQVLNGPAGADAPGGKAAVGNIPPPSAGPAHPSKGGPGVIGRIGSWLRGHLDVEETIRLPSSQLLPGRNLRITIDPGMFGTSRTVDVRLPADFRPGKPIRLRGLGHTLAGRKGDLYLKVLPKDPYDNDPDPNDAA